MDLKKIVGDWGGFEKLVAALHETGDVVVEHNVTLPGNSGAARQIDVLIRHKQGLYEHLIVVECKYWRKKVGRLHVDAMANTVRAVGASKGVIFSTKGFQSGAIAQAAHDGIDLFLLRDLKPEEWGRPGRIFDLFVQFIEMSFGHIDVSSAIFFPRPGVATDPSDFRLALTYGPGAQHSQTPILRRAQEAKGTTLEEVILSYARDTARIALRDANLFNNGDDGDYYVGCPMTVTPPEPFVIPRTTGLILLPKISVVIGLKFQQSRMIKDRGADMQFALAVESKVTGKIATVSRRTDAHETQMQAMNPNRSDNEKDAYKNGSVAQVMLSSYFDFYEISALTPVPREQVVGPIKYVDPNNQTNAK